MFDVSPMYHKNMMDILEYSKKASEYEWVEKEKDDD